MNQTILKNLKQWRYAQATKEQVECFKILHNKTLENIAEAIPQTKSDLLKIKGIGEKTYTKYGDDLLSIVHELAPTDKYITREKATPKEDHPAPPPKKAYTVSKYLGLINSNLASLKAAIQGEVNGINIREKVVYFNLKDKSDQSVINCLIWKDDYQLSGLRLQEGLEIIAHGTPEVYKPQGKLSFKVSLMELVGEGALKKAYEELKARLENEGLFDPKRKKTIPPFPQKIGLITSRDGEAIFDFRKNLGNFGFKITFHDSRVEGQAAIRDLLSALRYFQGKAMDAIVITRGGGSFESLNVFNSELLVREAAHLGIPVICGIGHERDVTLLSLAADLAVSTPTAAAKALNESWETAIHKIALEERRLIANYDKALADRKNFLHRAAYRFREIQNTVSLGFQKLLQHWESCLSQFQHMVEKNKTQILTRSQLLLAKMQARLETSRIALANSERIIRDNNPQKQLRLGYSITRFEGRIVRSIHDTNPGDTLEVSVSDGRITSQVESLTNY